MRVKTSNPDDYKGIVRLYLQFNEERIKSGVGDANYKYLAGEIPWAKTLDDPETLTIVAKEKGLVVGFLTLSMPLKSPFLGLKRYVGVKKLAEVSLVVVERRFRRQGVGTSLFDKATQLLHEKGTTDIVLNVKKDNTPAMMFWTKMGFKALSETEYMRIDGTEEKTVYLIKNI